MEGQLVVESFVFIQVEVRGNVRSLKLVQKRAFCEIEDSSNCRGQNKKQVGTDHFATMRHYVRHNAAMHVTQKHYCLSHVPISQLREFQQDN